MARVNRVEKMRMRENLEKLIKAQKEVKKQIDDYQQETQIEEYKNFLHDIQGKNQEIITSIKRYIPMKCKR